MEGQTATNPQTGEKIVFRGGQWQPMNTPAAPQAPGVIMGRPKQATPLQLSAEQRAQEDQARQGRTEDRQATTDEFNKFDKLRSDFDGLQSVKTYKVALPNYMTALKTDDTPQGDLALIYAFAKVMDPDSVVREGEAAAVSSSDTLAGQYVAALKKQLSGTGTFSPEARKNLREQLQNKVSNLNTAYNTERGRFSELSQRFNYNPEEVIGGHFGAQFEGDIQKYWDGARKQQNDSQVAAPAGVPANAKEYVNGPDGRPLGYYDETGEFVLLFDTKPNEGSGLGDFVEGLGNVATSITNPAAGAIQRAGETPGFAERILSGATLGLGDEIQGLGGSVGAMFQGRDAQQGYVTGRDNARARNQVADKRTGLAGDVVEIGSSLLVPLGAASTPLRAAASGATAGAIGGFGYGEGTQNSLAGAAIGAGAGAALGYGAGQVGNALASRQTARQISGNNTNALLQAGAQEGVTVNRAMANPELQPRVTGVSGTMAGSRSIERNMGEIGRQIEGRVADLGVNGTALTNEVGGGKVRAIAERQIKKSGEAAKKIYDRAEQASSGVKITPSESLARVDDIAKTLSETPGSNKAELEYLKTLKSDLSKDLSVGGLRRLRTKLRKSISKGDLVFGENEADVLSIMDSASLDIANGLRSQGKGGAAKLFEEADSLYRERAKYIEGTLQKLIGKRNSNTSDQQVFSKFKSLADPKGDGPAMERFMSEMSPDEVADVAATFAEDLGRNTKKEFSTAFLVSQAEKLRENPTALKAIFGDAGAKSLDNLIILSKEHNRVTNAARGSQTGLRADYRSWLTNAIFTGGAGLATGLSQGAGSGAIAATATAATVGAAKLGKDAISARLLMSPRVTGWLRSAPKTTSPAAINKHWAKLNAIAKAEPALAAEIDAFRNGILGAANDNAQRAVAEDRQN